MPDAGRHRPPRLRVGDTVAVVAPAGPVPAEVLDTGLRQVRDWGLHVRLCEHVRARHPRLEYLAGTDDQRAADLQQAWCDPDVRAVLCARGGFGSMRVLDRLDWSAMAAAGPKVLVGSSDVTALHDAFATQLDVVTLFGPMLATPSFTEDPPAREHLRRSLFAPEAVLELSSVAAECLVPGKARGPTYGGNLSVAAGSLGAAGSPAPPPGGIALLEDVTEDPYQLDRFVTQLRRAGWFDRAAGVALGSWTRCGPLEQVRATMSDVLGELGVPVLWEAGFGHCAGQFTVPLGAAAELDAEQRLLRLTGPALG